MSDKAANEVWGGKFYYGSKMARGYQPTKEDMEQDVSLDATPEELADALQRGGAPKRGT